MGDKSSLLEQLHVERFEPPRLRQENRNKAARLLAMVLLFLALASVAGWFVYDRTMTALPVRVVRAMAASREGQPKGVSILDANGYVVARQEATVSAKSTGRIVTLKVEEGQRVQKGQIIAQLDDLNVRADVAEMQAELQQARATAQASTVAFHDAQLIYERNANLRTAGLISNGAFDSALTAFNDARSSVAITQRQVEVAEARLQITEQTERDTIIRAPFAGVVTAKTAQAGDMVSPVSAGGGFTRTGICTIVDMDSLELNVDISENLIHRIHARQAVTITLNAYPDWHIPGEVIAVIPTADRAKATVKVRIGFKEKDPRILPEMGARVSVLDENPSSPVLSEQPSVTVIVPEAAVQSAGYDGVVFLADSDYARRREVKLGSRTSAGQLVTEGLPVGTLIVSGNLNRLSDGRKIRIEAP